MCQAKVHILPCVPEEVGDGTSCGTLEKDFFFLGAIFVKTCSHCHVLYWIRSAA
jgi:hypothetical protein